MYYNYLIKDIHRTENTPEKDQPRTDSRPPLHSALHAWSSETEKRIGNDRLKAYNAVLGTPQSERAEPYGGSVPRHGGLHRQFS